RGRRDDARGREGRSLLRASPQEDPGTRRDAVAGHRPGSGADGCVAMSEQFAGTMAVTERARFDVGALEEYLRGRIDGFKGPIHVEQFKGGQSNPTFKLAAGGRTYVMRR